MTGWQHDIYLVLMAGICIIYIFHVNCIFELPSLATFSLWKQEHIEQLRLSISVFMLIPVLLFGL